MPLFQAIQVIKSQDVAIKGVHLCYNEQVSLQFSVVCIIKMHSKQIQMKVQNILSCLLWMLCSLSHKANNNISL